RVAWRSAWLRRCCRVHAGVPHTVAGRSAGEAPCRSASCVGEAMHGQVAASVERSWRPEPLSAIAPPPSAPCVDAVATGPASLAGSAASAWKVANAGDSTDVVAWLLT